MNIIQTIKHHLLHKALQRFSVGSDVLTNLEFKINATSAAGHGDISTNIAMLLTKHVGLAPRVVAQDIKDEIMLDQTLKHIISDVAIAGPGFINITLNNDAWVKLVVEISSQKADFFKDASSSKKRYLIEYVSANPTGPLHLGHGRGAIIGDVLARTLVFLGNNVHREFYINDAGNQIKLLGDSLKARCLQQLGQAAELPEEGYAGEYMIDLAKDCVMQHGESVLEKSDQFFQLYAKEQMLNEQKATLAQYGITFDQWFSEKNLHDDGSVLRAIDLLIKSGLAYELDGALWFKSTEFGDDKDRVIRKSTGELTYIAADIAYHKYKFDRGYDTLIDILGHDHHGYVKRLKATMAALGYNQDALDVILYQLVTIKNGDAVVRMSKRAGTFTKLSDVIEEVGTDVARFFYLNRKADMPLDFDMAAAVKKSDENPVFYIQYAYVRIKSVLAKARAEGFDEWINHINHGVSAESYQDLESCVTDAEKALLKKIAALSDALRAIKQNHQTHVLSYYAHELAQHLHNYYTHHKVIDIQNENQSKLRMLMIHLVKETLDVCLDLLGISKPEKM